MPTSLYTAAVPYRKVLSANSTASAYTARTDSVALPTSAGYISITDPCNNVLLKFFGAGADNSTGSCRVYGVKVIDGGTTTSHTHVLLADYSFTLSAAVGVSSGVVSASERYADTITRTTGVENVSDQIVSPTGDVAGHVLLDCKGHVNLFIEPIVGTATSMNVLCAGV